MDIEKRFKYIIINKIDEEVILKNSYRDIADFINLIYPDSRTSHNTVGQRLKENTYFMYYDLIIKELIWK